MRLLTDSDPQRERRRQITLLDALEARYAPALRAEIIRASELMLATYQATGSTPTLVDYHMRAMADLYAEMIGASVEVFGGRVVNQGKDLGLILEAKSFAEFFMRVAREYISGEMIRRRITAIAETTRDQIIRQIDAGQAEGLGVASIAKRIADNLPAISKRRAALIARTETHGAANHGANEAAKATGLRLRKMWISVEDHRTRDFGEGDGVADEYNHRAMNGVTVDMDQPFKVPNRRGGFEMLMQPGDPTGSAGNVINCRCALGHVVLGLDD